MNRKLFFSAGAAVVALALVIYFVVSGFPPTEDVVGTMAADTSIAGVEQADRYRADAIGEADVELDDQTINDLLQNPDIVAALHNENFREAIADGSLMNALQSTRFKNELVSGTLSNALTADADFLQAWRLDKLQEFLQSADALTNFESVKNALRDEAALDALQSAPLRDLLTAESFLMPKNQNALVSALSSDDLLRAIDSGALKNALMEGDFLTEINKAALVHQGSM